MPKAPSDKMILAGAQARAAISAYLAEHPGEHSVAETATALNMRRNVVGRHLQQMADGGLIPKVRRDGTSKFYRWEGEPPTPEMMNAPITQRRKKSSALAHHVTEVIPVRSTSHRVHQQKGIELVVDGTMIVIERSSSGRLRFTLGDA